MTSHRISRKNLPKILSGFSAWRCLQVLSSYQHGAQRGENDELFWVDLISHEEIISNLNYALNAALGYDDNCDTGRNTFILDAFD